MTLGFVMIGVMETFWSFNFGSEILELTRPKLVTPGYRIYLRFASFIGLPTLT